MATVILLPGLACDEEFWRDIAPALAAEHRVVVSDVHFRHDTIAAMAAALLAEAADEALVLVGSSMGGMVALEAARQAPARVAALALLGSTARPDTPELLALRSQACELFAAGRMDEVLRANVAFAFHPAHARDAALVERYLSMIRRAGPEALIRQNRAVMARADARPGLGRIDRPALVVCGDADLLTPPEHSREMAALLPRARLEILEPCGHLLTLEQPDRVAALLLGWLGALGVSAAPGP
jgi:pimeloyl-ACP methyl ester carboxylesterase